ncbi:MAG: tetratricopeptide repeat protein [Bacteroidetes bacterium]|nr:tetratricopeptide repeat protein [Bacteroidota bacterium]
MKQCPKCERTFDDALAFCQYDATPLVTAVAAPIPPPRPVSAPHQGSTPQAAVAAVAQSEVPEYLRDTPTRGLSNRTAWIVVGVLALVGLLGLGGYFLFVRPPALERQVYAALDQGNVVTPENYSAYDYYHQLARDKPGSKSLERATVRVTSLVHEQTASSLQAWAERSEATDEDWARMARLASWNLELAPGEPVAIAQDRYVKAQLAFRAGQVREARSAFEQAIEAWPEWNLPYNSMGVTFAKARDYASAVTWYSFAAERSPDWSFPHANLGGAYYNLGRYGDAEVALLRSISIDGNRPGPHLTLAGVYERQGRYQDAINEMQTALRLDPNGTSGINVSRVQRKIAEMQAYGYY